MWLYRQIKKHPYLAMSMALLLGGVVFPFLYLMGAAWTGYAIMAATCLVAGSSLGGWLGWLAKREDRNPDSPSVSSPSPAASSLPSTVSAQARSNSSVLELKQNSTNGTTKEVKEEKQLTVAGKETVTEALPDVLTDIIIAYVGGDFGDSSDNKTIFPPAYFTTYCLFFMTTTRKGRRYNRVEASVFLHRIVKGDEEKAKAMLENNPALLFCTEIVTDYAGRKIKGTAYQIALGAEDIKMAKMIQPYFLSAYDGDEKKAQEEIQEQYAAQFTAESRERETKNAAADLVVLKKLIQAIREASEEDCQRLLDEKESKEGEVKGIAAEFKRYRAYLDEKIAKTQGEPITTGKHFNTGLLIEFFNQYDKNHASFGGWNSPKNNLLSRRGIGFYQRQATACLAQACCQGIFIATGIFGTSLSRSLQFSSSPSDYFFPLPGDWSGLGYDYVGDGNAWTIFPEDRGVGKYLLRLMSSKNSEMDSLRTLPASSSQRQILVR